MMKTWTLALSLSFLPLTIANPVPQVRFDGDRDPPVTKYGDANFTLTQAEVDDFKHFAEWSGSTYCDHKVKKADATIDCGNTSVCPVITAGGARVVSTFHATLPEVVGVAGLVGIDEKRGEIVVAFRASLKWPDWQTNSLGLLPPADCRPDWGAPDNCTVHTRYSEAWTAVSDDVVAYISRAKETMQSERGPDFEPRLVITGHSLGGAVATIAGAVLREVGYKNDVYTYGSPRVGNAVFARWASKGNYDEGAASKGKTYRITHAHDIVTSLQFSFLGARHTSPEYWIEEDKGVGTGLQDFSICEGYNNLKCSAARAWLAVLPKKYRQHIHYFGNIFACHKLKKNPTRSELSTAYMIPAVHLPTAGFPIKGPQPNRLSPKEAKVLAAEISPAEVLDFDGLDNF